MAEIFIIPRIILSPNSLTDSPINIIYKDIGRTCSS